MLGLASHRIAPHQVACSIFLIAPTTARGFALPSARLGWSFEHPSSPLPATGLVNFLPPRHQSREGVEVATAKKPRLGNRSRQVSAERKRLWKIERFLVVRLMDDGSS